MDRAGLIALAVTSVIFSSCAQAQTYEGHFYGGAQYSYMTVDRGAVNNARLNGYTLRGGAVLHQLFSVEVRAGQALGDDSYRDIKVENDFYYGGYLLMTLPLEGPVTPYGIGGYGYVENDFNGNTQRDDGASYGFGFDYAADSHLGLNLEYLRLADNDYTQQELISLGVTYHF
ncbi:hypothetical protein A11A3_15187 [Alcanivorax hongdengensis A-11-3]|uniref:Outer membrane protein beta-barrel domain-containing protein n=2 Tax=Alcanivorax hongdengensis TaxID=519051 RepID=L0W8U9_9GAMM|nr:hypothetical protein A11A3_15187 [Alcanivorax hongdengensis A-11-3]